MSKLKFNIEVEIDDIKVDSMHFSFGYKVVVDSVLMKEGQYYDSHAWGKVGIKSFEKILKDHFAYQLAIKNCC